MYNFPVTIPIKDVKDVIRKAPTAFDKEKVVEELRHPDNYTIVAGKHFTTVDRSVDIVVQSRRSLLIPAAAGPLTCFPSTQRRRQLR